MQLELSFIFPHVLREQPVSFLIPLPAQRPRTVANLAFMATGHLPLADELLSALHLTSNDIAYSTVDDAKAAGLVPFSDSAVIRIDKATVMEIGSSTTHSIFGGFVPDEALQLPADTLARGQSIAATMSSFKAGTLLYGNLGMPNTQASRYYILLNSLTTAEQRDEFAGFAPLGMVTSGLAELQRAVNQTAVQPRTLVPKKKVVVSACRMQLDYAQLASLTSSASSPFATASGERRRAEPQERVAGRVRRRDEDDEEAGQSDITHAQQRDPRTGAVLTPDGEESANSNNSSGANAKGFFQMSARFPKAVAQAVAASGGAALKRRRAEAYVTNADGESVLRTTAIAPGESTDGAEGERQFEFFKVQQDAFLNDIEDIKDSQRQRLNRNSNKSKKKQAFASHGLKKRGGSSGSGSVGGGHGNGHRGGVKAKQGKKVSKRY